VAVEKGVILPIRIVQPVGRVVEPELDMDRHERQRRSTPISLIWGLMHRLKPAGEWALRSPMRSIAREIEEVWPSSDL
jgi:hypothetical protein